MVATLLLGAGLVLGWAGDREAATASETVRADYEGRKAKVGRDAPAHVQLALWCEQHGLSAERTRHLSLAILIDPKNSMARGLSGLVSYNGQWKRPEAVSEKVKADATLGAKLAEYNARRDKLDDDADAHWKLAVWCEEQGLDAEARAHYTTVVRLDPRRDAAWKKLGCKKVGNRWVTEERLAAEKAESEAQKAADKKWRPLLQRWHSAFVGKNKTKREEAEASLDQISDPRAVAALWDSFAARGDEKSQAKAVEVLSRIEGVGASRRLAMLALSGRSAEVRRAAIETLRLRDVREVVGWLIVLIRKPIQYEIRRPGGGGSPGQLFVAGEKFNTLRDYTPRDYEYRGYLVERNTLAGQEGWNFGLSDAEGNSLFEVRRAIVDFGPGLNLSPNSLNALANPHPQGPGRNAAPGRPGALAASHPQSGNPAPSGLMDFGPMLVPQSPQLLAAKAMNAAQRRFDSDIEAIESGNSAINNGNALVYNVLTPLTGQVLPPDPSAWMSWWADQQGYAFKVSTETTKPTVLQETGPGAVQGFTFHHSCFRAGTPVRTLTGSRAIESIAVGDRVLVEDTSKGGLRYEPVLAVFHNKPARLYKVDLGSEAVWATGIHRFWKAGHGWVMARDLKPGYALRTLGGTEVVRAVEEGPVEPVFNLEVGGGQSFFVGSAGALVHDNSLVEPVAEPFDAPSPISAR